MATDAVRRYLYKLDDIYTKNRKCFKNYGAMIIFQTVQDYLRYWRELEDQGFNGLQEWECDELYFFFNEKLLEIARCHLDLYWLIYDFDGLPLYRDGREPLPFFHKARRKAQKHRYNKSLAEGKKKRSKH